MSRPDSAPAALASAPAGQVVALLHDGQPKIVFGVDG